MPSESDRCKEAEKFQAIDDAFHGGDLSALKALVKDPELFPNGPMPLAIGPCLVYAIYHSDLSFIRALLDAGADPNLSDNDGFPPLIAALSCTNPHPGARGRTDVLEVLELLLAFGADPDQRGINDYTPLHMAVAERNLEAVDLLLRRRANPSLRTRIDDYETPLEMAQRANLSAFAARLKAVP